ncbi:ABC transporter permease [Haloechinothrix alba]|nr:ABC transporter permease [Haloechinothrix alba]
MGSVVKFGFDALRGVPLAIRLYPSEIVRYAAWIVRQNSPVIIVVMVLFGFLVAMTAGQMFTQIGTESYTAAIHTIGTLRGVGQVIFGWIFAAKVGCGIVAEVGAMRISDEVDAMEVMGVRSVPYLVSSRLLASILVAGPIWLVSLALHWVISYVIHVQFLEVTSHGGYINFLFLFQNAKDLAISLIWVTLMIIIIIIVASYFGYNVQGGPVDVGRNTAQSMLVNLVLISVLAMILVQIFYGNDANAPIGN